MSTETHGMSGTRLYTIWKGIKRRCTNKNTSNFANYGGRGISICDEWLEFISFRDWAMSNGYNDTLQIDRKDNNGNYCPSNCHFVTRKVNNYNKRNNHNVQYKGKNVCIAQLSEMSGISYDTIYYRIVKYGWTPERAATTPISKRGRRSSRKITYNGKTLNISDMAKLHGIKPKTLMWRINHGMSVAQAIETPVKGSKN